ncbi:hypothetical protein DFJ74DRAFT_679788 [Hyaloraphidium curvatum]|nr:hypothetical protein DFJ74DRAFT_679788 [Hyaloraphidium curvatum]
MCPAGHRLRPFIPTMSSRSRDPRGSRRRAPPWLARLAPALLAATLLLAAWAPAAAGHPHDVAARAPADSGARTSGDPFSFVVSGGAADAEGDGVLGLLKARQLVAPRCAFNAALRRRLCDTAVAGATQIDIGSPDGRWAFVWSDGNPRVVFSALRTIRWNSNIRLPANVGCTTFAARFGTDGRISLRCRQTEWALVLVSVGGRPATRFTIDNRGVVRFFAAGARQLLAISPGSGRPAATAWRVSTRTATATRTRTTAAPTTGIPAVVEPRTTTQYRTPTTTVRMITPTLDPRNRIIRAGCTYLPVPFPSRSPSTTAADVFNIELISCGGNSAYDATFIRAAQTWMTLITDDLSDRTASIPFCITDNSGATVLSCGFVDDLIIGFEVPAIDGPGRILGSAGPQYYRSSDSLPLSGFMSFDSADMATMTTMGILEAVVLHEMGHVLGIGTLWTLRDLLVPSNCFSNPATADPVFAGPQAVAVLPFVDRRNTLPRTAVPVENAGGAGTRCSHFRETTFGNELMTGYVAVRGGNPLSRITAASLADMGYGVDMASAVIDASYDVGAGLAANSAADAVPGLELGDCLKNWSPDHLGAVGENGTVAVPVRLRRRILQGTEL